MPGERFIVGNPDTSVEDDTTLFFGSSCQDITGRTIPGGNHYVPGPDSCTVCLCDGGKPKWCQAVLCAAPKDCKSFRIGSSCCEFICLDNTEDGGRDEGSIDITWGDSNWVGGDLGVRLIATAVTAVLSLALLAFLFYRLRRRRVRRHSADCREGDATMIPSSSMASFEHGNLTNSTGHLSRQPQPMMNIGDNQSPLYLMWKGPTTIGNDNPPPYSTRNDNRQLVEDERQESMGLLSVPSAPSEDLEDITVVSVRRSNGTLDSELLDAGTPPPSYAEVVASCSIHSLNQVIATRNDENASGIHGDENEESAVQFRATTSLPRLRPSNTEAVIQRFSLQLALDYSDSSSCSSTSTQGALPISSSSSSSVTSIAHIGSN